MREDCLLELKQICSIPFSSLEMILSFKSFIHKTLLCRAEKPTECFTNCVVETLRGPLLFSLHSVLHHLH